MRLGGGITIRLQRGSPLVPAGTCWRCGMPFAGTTDEVLRRCVELARRETA